MYVYAFAVSCCECKFERVRILNFYFNGGDMFKIKKRIAKFLCVCVCAVVTANMVVNVYAEDFPHRKDYPTVPTISTQDLKAKYDTGSVVIIDVRSKIEFDVIHPKGTLHIPISEISFVADTQKVISDNAGKVFAFYCNGITCLKSYEGAQKLIEAGAKDCFAYDAGVPDWSEKYPADTLLLGKPIEDPAKQLIAKEDFKKRVLSFDEFKKKAAEPNTIVIDGRDNIQKSGKLPGLENVLGKPLDKLIKDFVMEKREQDKTLLIFDQVGKQVQWLDYYLRDNGYKSYYFLHGGATEVLEGQKYK